MITKKFGYLCQNLDGTTYYKPNRARFKCVLRMRGRDGNPFKEYFSWDIHRVQLDNVEYYYKNEELAYVKLEAMIRKKLPFEWYSASIFANITNDLDTKKKYFAGDLGGWDVRIATYYPLKGNQFFVSPKFDPWQSRHPILTGMGISNNKINTRDLIRQLSENHGMTQRHINFYNSFAKVV